MQIKGVTRSDYNQQKKKKKKGKEEERLDENSKSNQEIEQQLSGSFIPYAPFDPKTIETVDPKDSTS